MSKIKILLLLGCSLYLGGRIFFLCIYNFIYTDEDQIVMWLGTVLFSHGQIREPMWLGQNYGSRLDDTFGSFALFCRHGRFDIYTKNIYAGILFYSGWIINVY